MSREKERKRGRDNRKTWSDLWVSFQQSRLAPLSSQEHKSWKQRHNSGFPPPCNDRWNNVRLELLCPSCRPLPLYCHSRPSYSASSLCLLCPSVSPSLWLGVAPLSWCHSEGKCHTHTGKRSVTLPLTSASWLQTVFGFPKATSLSPPPWIQFQSFMVLSEVYKWRGSFLSVLLYLFIIWSVTFSLGPECLYYRPDTQSHLYSQPFHTLFLPFSPLLSPHLLWCLSNKRKTCLLWLSCGGRKYFL